MKYKDVLYATSLIVSGCIPPPCGTRWNQCGPRELMYSYDYHDTGYALQNQAIGWIDAVVAKKLGNIEVRCPSDTTLASPIQSNGFLHKYLDASDSNLENVLSLFSELDWDKDNMITISDASSAYYHIVYKSCINDELSR